MLGNKSEKKRKNSLTKSKEDKIILAISSSRRRSDLGIGINNLAITKGFEPQDIKAVAKKYGCKIAFGRDIVTNSLNNDKFCEARKAALMREERREKKKAAAKTSKTTTSKIKTTSVADKKMVELAGEVYDLRIKKYSPETRKRLPSREEFIKANLTPNAITGSVATQKDLENALNELRGNTATAKKTPAKPRTQGTRTGGKR